MRGSPKRGLAWVANQGVVSFGDPYLLRRGHSTLRGTNSDGGMTETAMGQAPGFSCIKCASFATLMGRSCLRARAPVLHTCTGRAFYPSSTTKLQLTPLMRILRAPGFSTPIRRPIQFTTLHRPVEVRPTVANQRSQAPLATMALPPKFAAHRLAFGQPTAQAETVPPAAHSIEIYLDYCVRLQAGLCHILFASSL